MSDRAELDTSSLPPRERLSGNPALAVEGRILYTKVLYEDKCREPQVR
jgi:hypothetical protein